jgi:hypothetical protein
VCPGNDESAGKRRSGRTHKGSKWLRGTLIEAARAAARTRDTYLAAQYQRVRARRGANRASLAVAHSLLIAVWHMLQTGETYLDPGGDYYTRRDPARTTRRSSPSSNASATPSPSRKGLLADQRDFLFRDFLFRQSGRTASRITPSTIMSPIRTPGSRTEIRLGVRAHPTRTTNHARAPNDQRLDAEGQHR